MAFDQEPGKRRKADIRHQEFPPPDPGCAVHPETKRKPSAVPKSDARNSVPQQSTTPCLGKYFPRFLGHIGIAGVLDDSFTNDIDTSYNLHREGMDFLDANKKICDSCSGHSSGMRWLCAGSSGACQLSCNS
jgi:hypothetical protein